MACSRCIFSPRPLWARQKSSTNSRLVQSRTGILQALSPQYRIRGNVRESRGGNQSDVLVQALEQGTVALIAAGSGRAIMASCTGASGCNSRRTGIALNRRVVRRRMLIRLAAGRSISENDSDPTRQGHPGIPPGVHPQKSTLAQPLNLIKSGAITPAECDIAQSSQIAHAEIPPHP